MLTAVWSLGLGTLLLLSDPGPRPEGYLFRQPVRRARGLRPQIQPYVPREGDLVFYDDHNPTWTALFALAGTRPPMHMGIVVRKSDGKPAVLEAGPDDTVWVRLLDAGPRLRQFHRDFPGGTVIIRRCKVVLSAEKSAALTKFAQAQDGKRYAVLRLLSQGTGFRVRGRMERFLAETRLDRDSWICSELAVAAGTVAGLFDPRVVQSNVAYPRDLVNNRRYALRLVWEDAAEWRPRAGRRQAAFGGAATAAPPAVSTREQR